MPPLRTRRKTTSPRAPVPKGAAVFVKRTERKVTNSGKTLLSVSNIEVIYDHVILVLRGVSLEVPEGGIVALLGANGAGKTTTLKAISNLLSAERGDVTKGVIEFELHGNFDVNFQEQGMACNVKVPLRSSLYEETSRIYGDEPGQNGSDPVM